MIYKCAICETRIYRPMRYFCWSCYKQFRDDIREKKEWTKFMVSEESKRRRREINAPTFVYLGNKWDIDMEGNLIRKDGYRYGQEKKRSRSSREN